MLHTVQLKIPVVIFSHTADLKDSELHHDLSQKHVETLFYFLILTPKFSILLYVIFSYLLFRLIRLISLAFVLFLSFIKL